MKRLANLLLVAITLALICFVAAPGVAFFAVRSAADARDTAGLARLIDYGQLRQTLRPQLAGNPAAVAPAPSFLEDPIGAFRRQIEQRPQARQPDPATYLTPAALAALTRGEGRYASLRSGVKAERRRNPWPTPSYWGVNRARFTVRDQGGSETVFTFERRGLYQWILVHIGLPDGASPLPPAVAPTKR